MYRNSEVADEPASSALTEDQKKRIEQRRQAALRKREKRRADSKKNSPEKKKRVGDVIDTGAGFFIEEEELAEIEAEIKVVHELPPLLDPSSLVCDECSRQFNDSYLLKHFDADVCDACKDENEKYDLITKTDARNKYLLKDCDFDRDQPLKFISKKNPHHQSWGEMKLYLKSQVEKRCLDVWESMEKIEEEKEKRQKAKEVAKQKKFDKKVKDLRMAVRSSLWTKDLFSHEHDYSDEVYDEESDEYSKTCKTCQHTITYEKM